MGNILPFRRSRLAGVRRFFGYFMLAVMIAAGGRYLAAAGPDATGDPRAVRMAYGVPAIAIDGDSLRVGHREIRLDGIDAPELHQTCRGMDDRHWPCGRAAKAQLADLVSGRNVVCTERGRDRYGRTLAVCSAGDVRDLGEALVRAGFAVNYDRYTTRYLAAQSHAHSGRRGIWRGSFQRPEDWRAARRLAERDR